MLEVDKNVKLNTPFYPNLIRTGTIGEGSCFFHSLFQSYRLYKDLTISQRIKAVSDIRNYLSKKVTVPVWLSLGKGELSKICYQQKFRELCITFYDYITDNKKGENIEKILSILTITDITNIYRLIFSKMSKEQFEEIIVIILQSEVEDSKMKDVILRHLHGNEYSGIISILFRKLLKLAKKLCYAEYVLSLKSCATWIGEDTIEFVSDIFDKDIYFIDSVTKMPYKLTTTCETARDSIVIYYISDQHYESIGRLDEKDGKKIITRLFKPDDPFIVKLRMYYCDKEKYDMLYKA
jgi:hypothetical protein